MARVTRHTAKSFRWGLVGLAAVILVYYMAFTAKSGLPFMPTTEVRVAFDDVGTLDKGSQVRENSKQVGRVRDITFEDGQVIVTLALQGRNIPVFADARAAIWDQAALGQKFVNFDRGTPSAGPMGDGVVTADQTVDSVDLDRVLDTFDKRTRDELTSAIRQLGGGAAGHSQDLNDLMNSAPALLHGAGTISKTVASPETDLPGLLREGRDLARAFRGHEAQTAALVRELSATAEAVGVDGGRPLRDSLAQLPGTLQSVRTGLSALDRPLRNARVAVATLRPGVRSLARATPDLRGFLRGSVSPLKKVPGVAKDSSPVVSDLTATVVDARPLVPRLSEGFMNASVPLNYLSPYAAEIRTLIERLNSLVSTYTDPGRHGARLGVAISSLDIAAGGVAPEPLLLPRNPYPAPGEADTDRAYFPLHLTGASR
jgi:phospholipid/cholesterol/gamma-HCH transport system substrate-binding protein